MSRITIRKMMDEDVELFKQWLYKPHVAKWYTEPEDWTDEVQKRNSEYNWIFHYIVEVAGVRIGFCQYYDYALGGETWHNNAYVNGAYSIDYMIGEEAYLGKGFGTEIIFALENEIRANTEAKKIIVQPDNENKASRNTLLSANYIYDETHDIFYKEL